MIARILDEGDGIPLNKKEAIKYYKRAAGKGDPRSMTHYGNILLKGDEMYVKEEAAKYFKIATEAMFNYANMKLNGIGVPVNKEEAVIYYKMAADIGHIKSMVCYSTILYEGDGVPVNKEEAAKYIKMAADKGERKAMMTYSMLLVKGDGVPANNI